MFLGKSVNFWIAIMLTVAVSVWFLVLSSRDRDFELWFFDVGQGDSIFVKTPGGRQILIDGGPDASVLSELSKAMPFWDRTIDIMVATHLHADHIGGLVEVLKRYQVGQFLINPTDYASPVVDALEEVIERQGIKTRQFGMGDVIEIGGLRLSGLWPILENASWAKLATEDPNQQAIVLLLEYNDFSALLMSDVEVGEYVPQELHDELKNVDVLKVPHQGSKKALISESLKLIDPEVAIITVGKNKFGHPAEETLELLENYNTVVRRTDQSGSTWIKTKRDGSYTVISK